jgi:hypothetical protein
MTSPERSDASFIEHVGAYLMIEVPEDAEQTMPRGVGKVSVVPSGCFSRAVFEGD